MRFKGVYSDLNPEKVPTYIKYTTLLYGGPKLILTDENQDLIKDIVLDLENRIKHEYDGILGYPVMQRKFNRDMSSINQLRKNMGDIFEV